MTNHSDKKHFWINILLSASIGIMMMLPGLCAAQNGGPPPPINPPAEEEAILTSESPPNQDAPVTVNELLYQFKYKDSSDDNKDPSMAGTKIGAVNSLPKTTWPKAAAEIVKILLNISGALALLAFTVGGTMMVLSSGNGELLEKGKKVTTSAVAGLVIIAVSYALVLGVSELQIFPDAEGTPATDSEQQAAPATQPGGSVQTGSDTGRAPNPN